MEEERVIVRSESPKRKLKLLGIPINQSKPQKKAANEEIFIEIKDVSGDFLYQKYNGSNQIPLEECNFYYLKSGSFPVKIYIPQAYKDKAEIYWDFSIEGHLRINDAERFFKNLASKIVTIDCPLDIKNLEAWVSRHIDFFVHDSLANYSIEELRENFALPNSWWSNNLSQRIKEFGLEFQVDDIKFLNAEAEALQIQESKNKLLEKMIEAKNKEREIELKELQQQIEYQKQKNTIETNRSLDEQQKLHALQMLEKVHRKEQLELDLEIENIRRASEKNAIAHELELARIQNDIKALEEAQIRKSESEKKYEDILHLFEKLQFSLKQIAELPDNLLARLGERELKNSNDAAERLISEEFKIDPATLSALGFDVNRQLFIEHIRKIMTTSNKKIHIRKLLETRDIGTVKINALTFPSTLYFRLTSERAGYITIINFGTSGANYLHVPNAYIGQEQAIIESNREYSIPGSELLPPKKLDECRLSYIEAGPPGWEHIAVMVSKYPLIDGKLLEKATSSSPFINLSHDDMSGIFETIKLFSNSEISAGILSFLVV